MKKFIILLLYLFSTNQSLGAISVVNEKTVVTHEQSSPQEIVNKAITSVEKNLSWKKVLTLAAEKEIYSLEIIYKEMPSGYGEVEGDTKVVARSLLKALVAAGVNPSKNIILISVGASVLEKGETGKELVRTFGATTYHFNTDELVFYPANFVEPCGEQNSCNWLL